MSARYWETTAFRRLHREWRLKLALSGFRDIETADVVSLTIG